jgi:hypothetical protein
MADDLGPPLKAATEKEILDELGVRYSGVFVAGCRAVREAGMNGQEEKLLWWRGGYVQALGLAWYGYEKMRKRLSVDLEHIEDDPESGHE